MKWISVEKRLPEISDWYLVYTDKVEILFFSGEKGMVKYWMPLPEPPYENAYRQSNEIDESIILNARTIRTLTKSPLDEMD